jgi:AcrR family transcriptional regulator
MSQTPLSRMLAEQAARPDALAAFKLARRRFLAGDRIEMHELASDLGVSRATVFRWVGSRDDLLVEVIWSLAEPTFKSAVEDTRHLTGGERVAELMSRFAGSTITSPPFMGFVSHEPERALRLLTTKASWFQARLVTMVEGVLREEADAGTLVPPVPLHDLAYIVIRLTETFVYAEIIVGELPDREKVRQVVGALLRD